jgi:hypothetical protein
MILDDVYITVRELKNMVKSEVLESRIERAFARLERNYMQLKNGKHPGACKIVLSEATTLLADVHISEGSRWISGTDILRSGGPAMRLLRRVAARRPSLAERKENRRRLERSLRD